MVLVLDNNIIVNIIDLCMFMVLVFPIEVDDIN